VRSDRTPSEPRESKAQEAEDRRSRERIEAGGIPLSAERRLRELGEGRRGGSFTSDLSIPGFALSHQLGLTPLSQVMGSSIYQMGYQAAWGAPGSRGGFGAGATVMIELDTLSRALNEVRSRALGRLAQEALQVGAAAVVEVQTRAGESDLQTGSVSLEHTVLGTAVRRRDSPGGGPVLTELSVAEYAQLLKAGFEPLGIVAWSSVFFASYAFGPGLAGGGIMMGMGAANYELREFTQAFYEARETVMARLSEQAASLRADGIVGTRISHTARRHELAGGFGAGGSRTGLMVTFNAIGTAIRRHAEDAGQAPEPVLDLSP
jgi:uncharacterized protein YbjQ (UPF0145 family)